MIARALDCAVEAARAAGDLLRREFHRTGGARGSGLHADIDLEVERLISARLREAFPSWCYVGEELGENGGDEGTPCWAVDPNDGTKNYLKGRRGPSVSLALIRDGEPVLGVVYAYGCPDDDGDLIAWAEGQPLTRNGQEVGTGPLAEPEPGLVVLSSGSAQRKWRANLAVTSPGRLLAMPSIAYRLALTAVGDADLGVTVREPSSWDMAAGQALLKAAGADLFNHRGEPVRYNVDGNIANPTPFYFGGKAAVVRHYLSHDWASLLRAPRDDRVDDWAPLAPVLLEPGRHIADAGVLARAQGCLLGQAAGDALGSICEFQTPGFIAATFGSGLERLVDGGTYDTIAGQPTDDTELALLLARSLVAAGGVQAESLAEHYAWWFRSQPFDIGGTTRNAVSAGVEAATGQRAEAMRQAAQQRLGSQANGSLMRISPLGVFGWQAKAEQLAQWAAADAEITHPNPVCIAASAALAIAIAVAIRTGNALVAYRKALDWCERFGPAEVTGALRAADEEAPGDMLSRMGWVLHALQNAFHHLLHTRLLSEAVMETVRRGGDTDTNAAVCGALLGAVHGRQAVPAQWRRMVLTCRPLAGFPGVKRPRPAALWPVDILELAERLLLAGAD
jgi:ADP-ribosylglycohydrolase/fructose-1,6-bisphosphatase/inositol monophosphatase family enzyme